MRLVSDAIDLAGLVWDANYGTTYNNGTLDIQQSGTTVAALVFDPSLVFDFQLVQDGGSGTEVVCFCAGTRIMTARGEVAVEDLLLGDRLVTRFGSLRPVKWIGRQSFDGRFLGKEKAPVCFRAGSIAPNVPCRDLYVSPEHAMVIDDRLILAKLLVNGVTITQEATIDRVDYFHIDLGVHDCVIANGAWSESYAEQDNRHSFHNAAEFAAAFPGHDHAFQPFCLPVADFFDPALLAIWAKLLKRVPAGSLTSDPDLHVLADGVRINPSEIDGNAWKFDIPAGAGVLRLRSHASSPAMMAEAADARLLGFCINSITAASALQTRTIAAPAPEFRDGVYPAEGDGDSAWRWTNGDCLLPRAWHGNSHEAVSLTIRGRGLRQYLIGTSAVTEPASAQKSSHEEGVMQLAA